jgi:hypothetical protein
MWIPIRNTDFQIWIQWGQRIRIENPDPDPGRPQCQPKIKILSRATYSIVLWQKFICDKSAIRKLINPPIVYTFTRQSWSSTITTFSSYSFAGVKIKYTHYNSSTYFFHLATKFYVWRA